MERPVEFRARRNFFIAPESLQKVRDVFAPAPCPAPLLFVKVFHRSQKTRRRIGIHVHRIKYRHRTPIAVVVQKTLPENPRILAHDVAIPKSDFRERFERHGVGRKSRQALGPRLLDHVPKRRRKGNHARHGRRLKDIIGEQRDRLIAGSLRMLRRQKRMRENPEVFGCHLGVGVKNRYQNALVRNFFCVNYFLLRLARGPRFI